MNTTHWTKLHPELIPRGESHWTRRRPYPKRAPGLRRPSAHGERHWTRRPDLSASIPRGERSGTAKLTEKDVAEIRYCYAHRYFTQQDLADIYEVDRSTIGYVVNHRTWTHT